jgi:hypothetical protein
MAQKREFPLYSNLASRSRPKICWRILIFLSGATLAAAAAPMSRAQFQQPLVFSSGGAVAVRNDQTGVLTSVTGSPFAGAPSKFTIDVQGRFLFAPGTNSIHMYEITDSTTGAYTEVAHSPFASGNTHQPVFIAVEPTGQFIAALNLAGQNPGDASVETFQISPTAVGGPALIPVPGSATELDSTPVGVAQPPDNKEFLIFMGPNPQSQNPTAQNGSEFQTLSIDPQTGFVTGLQSGNMSNERGLSFALDPQGRYYALGTRDNLLEIGNVQIIGIAGQLSGSQNLALPQFNYPQGLWIDSTGSFLYVATSDLGNPVVVNIYSVNLQNANLTAMTSSPLPGFTAIPAYAADPTGSFNYGFGSDANTVTAYTVDPLTGYFLPTANSPITISQIAGSLTFSIPPGQQGISGPSALLSATSLSFGTIQTGSASAPQTITLTSNGGEALSVNSISLFGADPSQFQETDTCQIPSVLQPSKFCSISITFAPTSTGSQQANLTITDNAPGSPRSIQITGLGAAPPPPAPAITASPNPASFAAITQGTTSNPITITVTNSGNATLHFGSVAIGGNNVNDFATTNGCSGAITPKGTCTITVTFAPLAAGERTETITLTDDASDSPQVINVGGNANPAITASPAPNGSTTQTVAAGQSAQFHLQLTPGAGYAGTVSLACSGTPLGAACNVPAAVQIANGAATPFTVTVTTSGSALLPPESGPRTIPLNGPRFLPIAALLFFLLLAVGKVARLALPRRYGVAAGFASMILFVVFGTDACGGGSSQTVTAPPPVITPQGTSTITVTPSAMSASGKPLQLQAIQLTLTVN